MVAICALAGCRRDGAAPAKPAPQAGSPAAAPPAPRVWPPDPDALPAAPDDLPPERRAFQVVEGKDRVVDAALAKERGLVLVDLSDDWAPFVFADGVAGDGRKLVNRYREIFVGLANDRTDGDGQPLRPGERNFLEPYGIPPSLSVLRRRFLIDGASTCFAGVDRAKLLAVDTIATFGAESEKKELERAQARAARLEAARSDAGVASLDELAASQPKLAKEWAAHKRHEAERAAFAEAEKRLVCEGLLDPRKHTPGRYDTAMRFAMLAFQQKSLVMAQGDISRGTLEALARPPLEADFLALQRAIAERVADAAGFIEDGSVSVGKPATYRAGGAGGGDGVATPVPDLVGLATTALLARIGAATPEEALEFFRRRKGRDFRRMLVATRLPAPPPYHSAHMELGAEIDPGDVWYEFPFDAKGNRLPQPRTRYPSFTLYTTWQGQRVPLVRWRTTIGGWRSELADDGQEYLRYKGSDVGPRVWRHVVAAPVWVPPPSTPLSGFIKEKWVNGAIIKVPNHDEVGPGYLSAYGLVAGIHVEPRQGGRAFFDNGIRTHGTFDYTSLRGRFSHGCHRLENHLAVRLFSFVLRHRKMKPLGPTALDFRRKFFAQGEVYDLRLLERGFFYELDPPLPVETLAGTVKGKLQKPLTGYMQKPGVLYARRKAPPPPGGPDEKAGGGAVDRGGVDGVGTP